MKPLLARVNLGAMAKKESSTFSKLRDRSLTIRLFSVIHRTHVEWCLTPSAENAVGVFYGTNRVDWLKKSWIHAFFKVIKMNKNYTKMNLNMLFSFKPNMNPNYIFKFKLEGNLFQRPPPNILKEKSVIFLVFNGDVLKPEREDHLLVSSNF